MTKFAPQNSYIDIKDFANISGKSNKFYTLTREHTIIVIEAGEYLKKVSEDDKLYSSFFWWKPFYSNVDPSKKFVKVTLEGLIAHSCDYRF